MNIAYRVHNDELSDTAREYAETRIAAFEKLLGSLHEAYITYTRDAHHKSGDIAHVEVSLHVEHDADAVLLAEADGEGFQEALDEVIDKLKHQVETYKHKQESKERSERRALEE